MSVTVGEEAYHLYCKSRYGDLQSLSTLEKRCNAFPESVVVGAELVWLGYYAKALFYFRGDKYDSDEGKEKAIALYTAILPALKAVVAGEEEDDDEEENCPHLQYLLGWYYHGSLGVGQDYEKSFLLFCLAANQGLAIAESNLGLCYALGVGVAMDKAEAIRWYCLAASKGHAPAQYNLGIQCIQETPSNYTRAAPFFIQASNQGFCSAHYMLGVMRCQGLGMNRDQELGCVLLQMAATKGYAAAQHALGQYYQSGDGVLQDYEMATSLMRSAAKQGLARSQFVLGIYYEHGIAVDEDNEFDYDAMDALIDVKEAVKWYRLAAAQDFPNALVALGRCFAQGLGVGVDVIEAVKWYTKAAEKNHPSASEALVAINDAYVEAIWNNRKSFLLFLAQYQFIYRPPSPAPTPSSEQQQAPLAAPIDTLSLANHTIEADPDVVHTVFHTEDMRREIMSFL